MIPMQDKEMLLLTVTDERMRLLRQASSFDDTDYVKKLSRGDLAGKTGIDEETLEKIESGEYDPPLSMLLKTLLAQGQTLDVKPYQAFNVLSAKEIGKALIEIQEKTGLTIEGLGEKFKITAQNVELWEKCADVEKDKYFIVSTPFSPPPKGFLSKLAEKFTEAEIEQASKIVLEALEILGVISLSPLLPSPEFAESVAQYYNLLETD